MSRPRSTPTGCGHGQPRVLKACDLLRSGFHERCRREAAPGQPAERGLKKCSIDDQLTEKKHNTIHALPSHGEAYPKAWARLHSADLRTSRRCLMREHALLTHQRQQLPVETKRPREPSTVSRPTTCGASTPPRPSHCARGSLRFSPESVTARRATLPFMLRGAAGGSSRSSLFAGPYANSSAGCVAAPPKAGRLQLIGRRNMALSQ